MNDLVEQNNLVKLCRQIVTNGETNRMQDILDCITKYTLMAREELHDAVNDNKPNIIEIVDYHLRCLIQINKCADALQQRIDDVVPQGSNYSWQNKLN